MSNRYIPETCAATKTYASESGAVQRAEAIIDMLRDKSVDIGRIRYVILTADNGRFVPVFFGQSAIEYSLFRFAHVIA